MGTDEKRGVWELASLTGGQLVGEASQEICDGESIDRAGPRHVTFVTSERNLKKLATCRAGCVLLRPEALARRSADWRPTCYIAVADPLCAFLTILQHFRPPRRRETCGISPEARISSSALIGEGTSVHPFAVVGEDVVIGRRCEIAAGVVIGAGCCLGDEVVLHPGVVLYEDVRVGNRVTIHAQAVIGADGFGYTLHEGRRKKIPHFGIVRIEDDVEIGAGTTIDRAMVGETVIGEGTKIDNLVMIAHNCRIGKHNAIVGQVGLAGSVSTGDHVVMAGHVGVADHVHLGEGCVIGSKAGVHKDVPPGETYIGLPAVPAQEAMRVAMAQKKLPQALSSLREAVARIAELEHQIAALRAAWFPSPASHQPAT